jgi:hypothetical protein
MVSAPLPAPGTGWKINLQTPTTGVSGGKVGPGFNINFTTGRGHEGTVFVPVSQYTEAGVRALITGLATTLDNVGVMTG